MIVLIGGASGPKMMQKIAGRKNIGLMTSPLGWIRPWGQYWATDNDVFAHCDNPEWWFRGGVETKIVGGREITRRTVSGECGWLNMLDKVVSHPKRPMFCLLPDVLLPGVIGDWPATLARGYCYLHELRERNLPVAIALQNGSERDWHSALGVKPDYVFIGGSTEWKWGYAEEICRFYQPRGVKVHIGRVSGRLKIREAMRIGADSCDGTGWARFPDERLPSLFFELDGIQPSLGL